MGFRERVHPRLVALVAVGLGVAGLGASGLVAYLLPDSQPGTLPTLSEAQLVAAFGATDSDLDSLPDAVENYRTGTDPQRWNTTGLPIPDGWLARFGYDPLLPGVASTFSALPPRDAWPDTGEPQYPAEFKANLLDVYRFGRPQGWDEASRGPWDNGLDPTEWDANEDGIPDGYALAFDLDPRQPIADQRLAGPGGLTVLEAYRSGTSPLVLDTDGDGLSDREEIAGPANPRKPGLSFGPTDPRKASTSGHGICDGYLVRHGLDPLDASIPGRDPDKDGATVAEEAAWTAAHVDEPCSTGGLDPTDPETKDAGLPDGWLIRYGLDPLAPGIASRVTQDAASDPGPPVPGTANLNLTVRQEYLTKRPDLWTESKDGPWWGGTDPSRRDTDGDGLGDAWETRGYPLLVRADVGPGEALRYMVSTDPTSADGDADGLSDLAEAQGTNGVRTDARRRDTDLDSLDDGVELGYKLLNATRADTAGDMMRDSTRLDLLTARASQSSGAPYVCGCLGPPTPRTVAETLAGTAGGEAAAPLTDAKVAGLLGPEGDVDADGIANLVDPDIDGDQLPNGVEHVPALYARTPFGNATLRKATDPLNPDTDGDKLRDGWEVEHSLRVLIGTTAVMSPDPHRWDTDGNGQSDGVDDPDKDGITWFGYRSGGAGLLVPVDHKFAYDNLAEQESGSDPRNGRSDGDGLLDGWKAFWADVYPTLEPGGDPDPGVRYPGSPGPLAIDPAAKRPQVGTPQSGEAARVATVERIRFVSTGTPAEPGEEGVQIYPNVQRQDGTRGSVTKFRAQLQYDFSAIQGLGSNPYMVDTDGDGMDDPWEWAHRTLPAHASCLATGGPSATVPDGAADPDGDTLSNAQERLLGTHPLCSDTDQGGVKDGQELSFGLDPRLPTDDFVEDGRDQDLDGLTDLVERRTVRTSPLNPDSDGDGLLDGCNQPGTGLDGCNPVEGWPADNATARRFLDLGIAFSATGPATARRYTFLGERDFSTDPLRAAPGGDGIPQGWLVALALDPQGSQTSDAVRAGYRLGRPSWWAESAHGVWWGGAGAAEFGAPAPSGVVDLDADGLGDANGEDPFPAVNHCNRLRPIDWSLHRLEDPGSEATARSEGLSPGQQRLLAQAILNPRQLDSRYSRDATPDGNGACPSSPRATPTLADVHLDTLELERGLGAVASGRLLAAGAGVPDVPVVAEIEGDLYGVGVTQADGSFTVPVLLVASQSMQVPAGVFALLGEKEGEVAWTAKPQQLAIGPITVTLRSYATPSVQRAASSIGATLTATTVVTVEAPEQVLTGTPTSIRVRVADAAGFPLPQQVVLHLPSGDLTAKADANGLAQFPLTLPHSQAGVLEVSATALPSAGIAEGTSDVLEVRALQPTSVEVQPLGSADDATSLLVRGRIQAPSASLQGVGVEARLSTSLGNGAADAQGNFQVLVPIPVGLAAGSHAVLVQVSDSERTAAATTSLVVHIRARPVLTTEGGLAEAGNLTAIKGRLTLPGGEPLGGISLHYDLEGVQGTVVTAANGSYLAHAEVERVGPLRQQVTFPGNELYGPVTTSLVRSAFASTRIDVEPRSLMRGTEARVTGRLVDSLGNGLGKAALEVGWDSGGVASRRTDAQGGFDFAMPTDALEPGLHILRIEYGGSHDGSWLPRSSRTTWAVQSATRIDLPLATELGAIPGPGRLVDEVSGQGLPSKAIVLGIDGLVHTVFTDSEGRFTVLPALDRPGIQRLTARFGGDEFLKAAQAQGDHAFQVGVRLAGEPADIPRGEPALLRATLRELSGHGIDGSIGVYKGDDWIGGGPCTAGSCVLTVELPEDQTLGPVDLRFRFVGNATHHAGEAAVTVNAVRKATLEIRVDELANGTRFIHVRALAEDRPLAHSVVHIALGGLSSGLSGPTDENGGIRLELPNGYRGQGVVARLEAGTDTSTAVASASLGPGVALSPPEDAARWPWLAAAGAGLAVLLVGIVLLARRRPLDRTFVQARLVIASKGPVEAAILAAYDCLERTAVGMGWAAKASTPRSLRDAMAQHVPLAVHDDLDRLVRLFEEARYGRTRLPPTARETADRCLARLRSGTAWRAVA